MFHNKTLESKSIVVFLINCRSTRLDKIKGLSLVMRFKISRTASLLFKTFVQSSKYNKFLIIQGYTDTEI